MSKLNYELYKKLFLIRKCEEKIIEHYNEDEMKTPMHMSMGEEAIVAGICHALKRSDQVFGTYRSHALYLAKTSDISNFFFEMYGKGNSILKGKCGSMHLCSPGYGFMGTSAIVGSIIPVAVGAAFANKMKKNNKIVAVFFGDGAVDEGGFWESLNVACLMKLPVIFVCEDNGLAVHTPVSQRHGYKSIAQVVSKFSCNVFTSSSTDAENIYNLTRDSIRIMKKTKMPSFMHLKYYRYLEHVGINEDFDAGYRKKSEFKKWYKIDPVKTQRDKLIENGFGEDRINRKEKEITERIKAVIRDAKKAHFSKKCELYKGIFS